MASKVQTSDNQEINEISVYFLNRISLFLLLPMSIAPFIGLHLYTYGIWMSFCLMAVGLIQLLCIIPLSIQSRFGKPIAFDLKFIKTDEILEYAKKEKKIHVFVLICSIIIGLLDLFPLLCMFNLIPGYEYEGGIVVTLLSIILCVLIPIFVPVAFDGTEEKCIMQRYSYYKLFGTTSEEYLEKERKKEERRKENRKKQHKIWYGDDHIELGCGFIINDTTKKIYYNYKEYSFDDILDFSVQDNSVTENYGSVLTSSTDTKSMLGRAAIGGVLAGGAGAVVGGATAKRTTISSGSQSKIIHDFSVIITVNNIKSPNITIHIGNDEVVLNKIVSTLTVILHQKENRQ